MFDLPAMCVLDLRHDRFGGMKLMAEWFYGIDGQQHGPVDKLELQYLAGSGKLQRFDKVIRVGEQEWIDAKDVPGLFPEDATLVPPLPSDQRKRIPTLTDHKLFTPAVIVLSFVILGTAAMVVGLLRRDGIPKDVSYRTTITDEIPDVKLSIDVFINGRVEEDVLKAIAEKLYKNHKGHTYERVFIGYYLPGMKVDSGYWATTHYNPDLEVRVLPRPVWAE